MCEVGVSELAGWDNWWDKWDSVHACDTGMGTSLTKSDTKNSPAMGGRRRGGQKRGDRPGFHGEGAEREREQLDMWRETVGNFAERKISVGCNGSGRVGPGCGRQEDGCNQTG